MDTWIDLSKYLEGRLSMMVDNMVMGAILVFVVLSLFLRMKVAFWVIVGLPICFLGALWLMPTWPVTINTISLFGFIIVLGIVVDDAIIIGESIYTKIRSDGHTLDNVIHGAHRVAIPATFGVLTTIAAFGPLMFVGGMVAPFFEAMAFVVMLCLLFSLVESKLILPAHLVHASIPDVDEDDLFRPQRSIPLRERPGRASSQDSASCPARALCDDSSATTSHCLRSAIDNRGVTVATFVAVLIVTFGLMASGIARVVVFPELASDFMQVHSRWKAALLRLRAMRRSTDREVDSRHERRVRQGESRIPCLSCNTSARSRAATPARYCSWKSRWIRVARTK